MMFATMVLTCFSSTSESLRINSRSYLKAILCRKFSMGSFLWLTLGGTFRFDERLEEPFFVIFLVYFLRAKMIPSLDFRLALVLGVWVL